MKASELPNLTHIQSFYSVAKYGSLGAATRAEGGSLPTLSRHIAALENKFGVTLFDRRGDGFALTQTGVQLFEYAEEVRAAGVRFASAASGEVDDIAGTIRISASRIFSNFILPSVLARLGEAHPDINIDLVVTDVTSNLLMREADIAVRMFRPKQSTLIARQIGTIGLGAYASADYIARKGMPQSFEDLKNFDIIGDDDSDQINAELSAMGIEVGPNFFRYRCDDPSVAWKMVQAGCGIGLGLIVHAKEVRCVSRIMEVAPEITRPVWLTSHAELKTNARVRTVFDFLADEIANMLK